MKKLILTLVILLSSIATIHSQECVKSFDCSVPDENGAWRCVPLVGNKSFTCQYESVVEPTPEPTPIPTPTPTPPSCTPIWCSAPLIQCTATPIQGVDSCGEICTKPSPEWPKCKDANGNTIELNFGNVN